MISISGFCYNHNYYTVHYQENLSQKRMNVDEYIFFIFNIIFLDPWSIIDNIFTYIIITYFSYKFNSIRFYFPHIITKSTIEWCESRHFTNYHDNELVLFTNFAMILIVSDLIRTAFLIVWINSSWQCLHLFSLSNIHVCEWKMFTKYLEKHKVHAKQKEVVSYIIRMYEEVLNT